MNYLCDFQYTKNGHHDADFLMLKSYMDGNLEHVYSNEKSLLKRIMVIMQAIKLNGNITIGTCSFVCLYIASVLAGRWNYNLVVHFLPENRPKLYKYLFSKFLKRCKRIIVYAPCVGELLCERFGSKYRDKIYLVHTREIEKLKKNVKSDKKTILVIGNIVKTKHVDALLNVLNVEKFDNLEFKFICKGIADRLMDLDFQNKMQNNVVVEDRFPDMCEYKEEMYNSSFVYLDYDSTYGVRCSAVLLDSISHGTPVIANDNKSFSWFVKKYNCGYIYQSEIELKKILVEISKPDYVYPEFSENLFEDYSVEHNKKRAQVLGE